MLQAKHIGNCIIIYKTLFYLAIFLVSLYFLADMHFYFQYKTYYNENIY